MKVLFTINRMQSGSGGAQRVVSLLCNGIVNQGHDVMLILYEDRTPDDYYISEKVNVVILPRRKEAETVFHSFANKVKEIKNYVNSFKPDVIMPFLSDQTLLIYLATRFTKYRKKIVTTVRNNPRIFPKQRKYRWRNNVLIAINKACFCQNDEQKDYFPEFIKRKTFVLPNPVSDELLYSERNQLNLEKIISVGRLSEQKNQKMLIDAFAQLADKYPQISLDIYGDGNLKQELQAHIDSLKMANRIKLCGVTNNVKEVLLSHGLFVMTSDFEGMPNALIEAMATGMACISTDCPTGPSDLIENKVNGLLISMGNVDECVTAIEYMLLNNEKAIDMGKKSKEIIAENYSCDKISRKLLELCKTYVR